MEPRKLSVHVEYARRCIEVAVGDYGAFRDAVQQAMHRIDDDLVFGKPAPPPPPANGPKANSKSAKKGT